MGIDPCRICGEPARVEKREGPRKQSQKVGPPREVRVCTSPSCPSWLGRLKMNQRV